MTIEQYKKTWQGRPWILRQSVLETVLLNIKFLESIYMTGGENHHFSKTFEDSALAERQELCRLSSALYSIEDDENK